MGEAKRRKDLGIERSHHSKTHLGSNGPEDVDHSKVETRRIIMMYAGFIRGTFQARQCEAELRYRAGNGDRLAKQLLQDAKMLGGGTPAAVRKKLHSWFAKWEPIFNAKENDDDVDRNQGDGGGHEVGEGSGDDAGTGPDAVAIR